MLHFGAQPRFSENVKIIQVDLNAEELGNNTSNCVQVQSDIKTFTQQVRFFKSNIEYSMPKNFFFLRVFLLTKN
jgi:2-hydroxyacyl-CoA lyase 1